MSIDKSRLRTAGIYLIAILAIARLLIMPMHRMLDTKKSLLSEKLELSSTRQSLLERQTGKALQAFNESEAKKIAGALYAQGIPLTDIQAQALKDLIDRAEKKGITVLNFEMPDAVAGNNVSEAVIIIRMQGQTAKMIELLGEMQKSDKFISVKAFETLPAGDMQSFTLTVSAFRAGKP